MKNRDLHFAYAQVVRAGIIFSALRNRHCASVFSVGITGG